MFLVIPKLWGFKKYTYFFTGFAIHFGFQTGTLEIVPKKKVKLNFWKENAIFDRNIIAIFEIF